MPFFNVAMFKILFKIIPKTLSTFLHTRCVCAVRDVWNNIEHAVQYDFNTNAGSCAQKSTVN